MEPTPIDQRLVRGFAGTLDLVPVDQEGEPVVLTGPVHLEVVDHTGATVIDSDATETDGTWSVAVAASLTAELARWTCTWTDTDDDSARTTTAEVAGGHLFTVAQARGGDPLLAGKSSATIITHRLVVEAEAEWICDVAFTPRLRVATLDGSGTDLLDVDDNACSRLVSVATATGDDLTTGAELYPDGTLWREARWPAGRRNIEVVWEAGRLGPPPDLRDAMCARLRTLLLRPDSNIPLRALQLDGQNGAAYKLDRASKYRTGVPDVDAVYARYSMRPVSAEAGPGPAHASIEFDPRTPSLFHGPRV
ncbi:MAG: hypothetical protein JWM89_1806 [Acidimicrobiales bacterium]|nr:hypothetical protein [Acidimicrobiales bacterium]